MKFLSFSQTILSVLLLAATLTGCNVNKSTAQTKPGNENGGLFVKWEKNILTISGQNMMDTKMNILYLEAFCKPGSTNQEWDSTTIPHKTELLSSDDNGRQVKLRSLVQPNIEVLHDIKAGVDDVDFNLVITNKGDKTENIEWFQPCIRVNQFTNREQDDYISRCFIFTKDGLTTLDKTNRTHNGFYKGGQTWVPPGINLKDVNPRPISPDIPVNGLIGCFSDDNKYLMAAAWDHYQELFQGIFVCIHSDPRIGGLKPGEVKHLHGKIYFLKNDPAELLKRYKKDFPGM